MVYWWATCIPHTTFSIHNVHAQVGLWESPWVENWSKIGQHCPFAQFMPDPFKSRFCICNLFCPCLATLWPTMHTLYGCRVTLEPSRDSVTPK